MLKTLKTLKTPVLRGRSFPRLPLPVVSPVVTVIASVVVGGVLATLVMSGASASGAAVSVPDLSLASGARFVVGQLGHPLIEMLYASAALPSMAEIGATVIEVVANLLVWLP